MAEFRELARAKIQESRNLVVSKMVGSECFTIAQQLVVNEGTKTTTIFMKGAIHVDGIDNIYGLRNALNEAIEKVESDQK